MREAINEPDILLSSLRNAQNQWKTAEKVHSLEHVRGGYRQTI